MEPANVDPTTPGSQPTAASNEPPNFLILPSEIRNLIYDQIFYTQVRAHTSQATRLTNRQLRLEYEAQALSNMRLFIHSFAVEAFRLTGVRLGFRLPSNYRDIPSIHMMLPLTYLLQLEGSPPDPFELSITMGFLLTVPPVVHTVTISLFDDVNDAEPNYPHSLSPAVFKVCYAVSLYFTKRDVTGENKTVKRVDVRWNEHLTEAWAGSTNRMVETNNMYWEGEFFEMGYVLGRHTMKINGLSWVRKKGGKSQAEVLDE